MIAPEDDKRDPTDEALSNDQARAEYASAELQKLYTIKKTIRGQLLDDWMKRNL